MPAIDRIRPRGGTAAQWVTANPVLQFREMGLETDTGKVKYGDGSTAWNSLSYSSEPFDDPNFTGTMTADAALFEGITVLGAINSQTLTASGIGTAVQWNLSGGLAEQSFLSLRESCTVAFAFAKKTGASTYTHLVFIMPDGALWPGTDGGPALGSGTNRWEKLFARRIQADNLPTYADDAAAGAGGLASGEFYKASDGASGFNVKVKA